VIVLSISEKFNAYASEVLRSLRGADLRAEADLSAEKIGAKIRDAAMQKVPYMVIVGEKEATGQLVSVRSRSGGDQGPMPLGEFIERCQQEIATRGGAPATKAS
jgi:threonyl-tRNA synthetase